MPRKKLFQTVFILLFILASLPAVRAAEWFVRPGGPSYGSADGSSYENAWSGFGAIVWGPDGMKEGDTLFICGIHRDLLNVAASGAPGFEIHIRGDCPREAGVIDSDFSLPNCLIMAGQHHVIVESLLMRRSITHALILQGTNACEVRDCSFALIGATPGSDYTIDGRYAGGARIINNGLSAADGRYSAHGIIVNTGDPNPAPSLVALNRIDGISGDGITAGNNVMITNNTVSNLLNTAVHSDGIVVQGSNVAVARNTVFDCTQNIYVDSFDYGGTAQSVCNDVSVYSNLLFGTAAGANIGVAGISVDVETGGAASLANLRIYNNTVVDCTYHGMNILDRSQEGGRLRALDIRDNILVNNGGYNGQFRFSGLGDNSLRPGPGSPALGAGINLGPDFADDRDGRKRPAQSAWDLGCFEVSGSP